MKRAIATLSILCGGLLAINPVVDMVFAQNTNDISKTEIVNNRNENNIEEVLNKEDITQNDIKENIVENIQKEEIDKEIPNKINKEEKEESIQIEKPKEDVLQNNDSKEEMVEQEKQKEEDIQIEKPKEEVLQNNENKEEIVEQEQEKEETQDKVEVLNKEQAEILLKNHNTNANYTYQGDETNFSALAQKGFSGYVFLPDYETDLGFFVDKNNGSVYYFHPSGYMELA